MKSIVCVAITLLISVMPHPCRAASGELHQVALIIGNGGYEHVTQLKNPPADAKLLAEKLQVLGYEFVGSGVHIDVGRTEFKDLLASFLKAAAEADVAFFYYSGHAVQIDGENYLIPIDSDADTEDDVVAQAIAAANFVKVLSKAPTKLNSFILDACRDNPFAEKEVYAATKSLGSPGVGLAEMRAPPGTIIWFATEPGKKAKDTGIKSGPYAAAIAKHITRQNLNVYDFFNVPGLDVFKATEQYQIPWLAASVVPGIYYFHGEKG
jgi:uncharacterized caspase-like protein